MSGGLIERFWPAAVVVRRIAVAVACFACRGRRGLQKQITMTDQLIRLSPGLSAICPTPCESR